MVQDVVEDHQPRFDFLVSFDTPVLRFFVSNQAINGSRTQVVDVTALPAIQGDQMTVRPPFFDQLLDQSTWAPLHKSCILPRKEEPG